MIEVLMDILSLVIFPAAFYCLGRLVWRKAPPGHIGRKMTNFGTFGLFATGLVALVPALFLPMMIALVIGGLLLLRASIHDRG